MGKLSFFVKENFTCLQLAIGNFPMPAVPKNNFQMSKNPTCDDAGTMHRRALHLVNSEPRGLVAVFQKTGVPFYWLQKFSRNKIPKPNANRVQTLVEKLSGKKIKLP